MYECRSTRLAYTGLLGGLEHLKIETRLINERFASVKGECVLGMLAPCNERRKKKEI